jgi:hypothetical protein
VGKMSKEKNREEGAKPKSRETQTQSTHIFAGRHAGSQVSETETVRAIEGVTVYKANASIPHLFHTRH